MPLTLVQTKLNIPRLGRDLTPRPALVQRLNAGLGRYLTLVTAPAGFGKTTLVVEWASQSPHRVAWLSLDEGDNDLAVFVGYMMAAIQRLFPGACPDTQALLRAPRLPDPKTLASILINEIDDLPDRFVLVLDDYHFMAGLAIHQLLDSVLQRPPLQLHLVLISRSDPPLALARLRANRTLSELRMVDLRFSKQEAEVFLAQTIGPDVSEQLAEILLERVEGWIAGLQLASLSIRAAPDTIDSMQLFIRGRNRYIMAYLFEQVLQRQTLPVQQFLVTTSILDRLSSALAQAVLAEDAALSPAVDLAGLAQAGLFLNALDDAGEWFSYHALFRELLNHTLQSTHSRQEITTLHRRASLWFRQNGLVDDALRQALAAGDAELAAQIVADYLVDQYNRYDWHPVQRWLAQLPAEAVETHPWLLVAEAYVLHLRAQWSAMLPVLKRAEQRLNARDGAIGSSERALLRGYLDGLWAVHWMSLDEAELAKEAAQKAIYNLPPAHFGAREVALTSLIGALHSLGDFATAERILNEMLAQESLAMSDGPATLATLFALVGVYVAEGHVFKLEQAARMLRQKAAEANIQLQQAWAHMGLGVAAYESNDLSRAAEHFTAGAALRHAGHIRAGHECLVGLALVEQARGHSDEARRVAAQLLDYHRELVNPVLSAEGDSLQARLALVAGEVDAARRWNDGAVADLAPWWCWWLEVPAITRLRVSVADRAVNNLERTRRELDTLLELVTRLYKPRRMIELLTLKALLLDRLEESDEALKALEAALALGEPRGLVRAIADAGPQLEPLLRAIARRASSHYLDRILAALYPTAAPAAASVAAPQSGPLLTAEPLALLTHREQDVLMLLGQRYSDREIAEALVISPLTVRTHIENLSEKLGVHGRRAVVARARELGLLAVA